MFKDVKNNNYNKYQMDTHPYDDKTMRKMIKLVPVKDKKVLELCWIL